MKKITCFKTRIISDNVVYLLAGDVAGALGYTDVKTFIYEHEDIIDTTNSDFPELVAESDFNHLLLLNQEALQRLGHIEITKVDTLRSHTEAIKNFYPLKYMMEGKVLNYKAVNAGYQSVSEYLEKVEFIKDIKDEMKRFASKEDILQSLEESKKKVIELIDFDILKRNGLSIQSYIHIKSGTPYEEHFIVGKGIFFSIYDSDYAFNLLKVINGDIIIPTCDNYEDFVDKNYGHDLDMRDYRDYSTLENIMHIITHKKVEDVGVDLLCCEVDGINFYISQSEVVKLLNPNMYREIMLIDGTANFDYEHYITKSDFENKGKIYI